MSRLLARRPLSKRTLIVAGISAAVAVAFAPGTFVQARDYVTSGDIKNQTIQSWDIASSGVGRSELRKNSVGWSEVQEGSLDSSELTNGGVKEEDLDAATREKLNSGGPQGPQGPKGDKGDPGEPGEDGKDGVAGYERVTNDVVWTANTTGQNAHADCPAGKQVLGGGYRAGRLDVVESRPGTVPDDVTDGRAGLHTWSINGHNRTNEDRPVRVWAICAAVN